MMLFILHKREKKIYIKPDSNITPLDENNNPSKKKKLYMKKKTLFNQTLSTHTTRVALESKIATVCINMYPNYNTHNG